MCIVRLIGCFQPCFFGNVCFLFQKDVDSFELHKILEYKMYAIKSCIESASCKNVYTYEGADQFVLFRKGDSETDPAVRKCK